MRCAILALAAGLLMTVGTSVTNAGECTKCRAESSCAKGYCNTKCGDRCYGGRSGCRARGQCFLQRSACHRCRLAGGRLNALGQCVHGFGHHGCAGGHVLHPYGLYPHGNRHQCQPIGPGGPYTGPSGPSTATYGYPYYTIRGPRDFLMDNPPTIGR